MEEGIDGKITTNYDARNAKNAKTTIKRVKFVT